MRKSKPKYYEGIGRRKTATARVRIYPISSAKDKVRIWDYRLEPGAIFVNRKPVDEYFPADVDKIINKEPMRTTNTLNKFAVTALISGSGKSGQLGALVHGLARALEKADKDKYRSILKKRGFLTRDPRMKERRKAGFAHAARAKKQSPKR